MPASKKPNPSLNIPQKIPSVSHPLSPLKPPNVQRSSSGPLNPSSTSRGGEDFSRMNPDDMFRKFTVAEVRAVQARLRGDADAKQEELRLMVGERYRDLLEASSAIEAISHASQRVVTLLDDMKDACDTSSELRKIHRTAGVRNRPQSISGTAMLGRGTQSSQDSQLVTLQILAAHLKLLLDAPEQLWRFLERKQHLHAAWLLLLSGVVYRALVREDAAEVDEENEIDWAKEGIDVLQQFPLARRQWESINQFRAQVAHRATLSLRDLSIPPIAQHSTMKTSVSSSQSIAETLLSIVLLESLPVPDSLSLFLSQRTKALQSLYSNIHSSPVFSPNLANISLSPSSTGIFRSRRKNREAAANLLRSPGSSPRQSMISPNKGLNIDFRLPHIEVVGGSGNEVETRATKEKRVREVRQSLRRVLECIALTMGAVRDVFGSEAQRSDALMEQLLAHVQLDHSTLLLTPATTLRLHANTTLQPVSTSAPNHLTTKQLLLSLPSSNLLVRYLPGSIQSFTPYVDTISTSSALNSSAASSLSSTWFQTSLQGLQENLTAWFNVLGSVREIWSIWIVMHKLSALSRTAESATATTWLDRLTKEEQHKTLHVIKAACMSRVKEVCKERLLDIEVAVVKEVQRCVELLKGESPETKEDVHPLSFTFSPTYLTSAFEAGSRNETTAASSVNKYKTALRQRVDNRTPLINSVVIELEQLAKDLRNDVHSLVGPGGCTKDLAVGLMQDYKLMAHASLSEIASSLNELLRHNRGDSVSTRVNVAIFVGKLALDLGRVSSFPSDLLSSDNNEDHRVFRDQLDAVHGIALEQWSQHAISQAMGPYRLWLDENPHSAQAPSGPSHELLHALSSLASSVHCLGVTPPLMRAKGRNESQLLQIFIDTVAEAVSETQRYKTVDLQLLWDLSFLSALLPQQNEANSLKPAMEKLRAQASDNSQLQVGTDVTSAATSQTSRLQLLLGSLIPPPAPQLHSSSTKNRSAFVHPGGEHADSKPTTVLEFAKPTARFGMLMVPRTT